MMQCDVGQRVPWRSRPASLAEVFLVARAAKLVRRGSATRIRSGRPASPVAETQSSKGLKGGLDFLSLIFLIPKDENNFPSHLGVLKGTKWGGFEALSIVSAVVSALSKIALLFVITRLVSIR